MKSTHIFIYALRRRGLPVLTSDVPILPDHDLPLKVRFLLLHRCHYSGESAVICALAPQVSLIYIQLLIVVLQTDSAEFGLTIAAIPVVLFLLIGAGIAVQREIKWSVLPVSLRR